MNAVNPGVVVTQIHKRGGMNDEAYAAFLEHSKTTHPLGRTGRPEEIASLVLCSRVRPGLMDHRRNLFHRRWPWPNLCPLISYTAVPNEYPTPTIVIRTSPQISAIRLVLAMVASLIALFLGLLVLLLIGIETGPVALLLGFVTATIPVPIYIVLVLWIDRYEAEPLWMLATAFFWGALIATSSHSCSTQPAAPSAVLTNAEAGEAFAAVISRPLSRKSARHSFFSSSSLEERTNSTASSTASSTPQWRRLGFAMSENILYYGKGRREGGGEALTATLIMRGFFAPFSHPLFTSLTGIGLGLARQSTNIAVKATHSNRWPVDGYLHAQHLEWFGSVWRRWRFPNHLHPGDGAGVLHHAGRDLDWRCDVKDR